MRAIPIILVLFLAACTRSGPPFSPKDALKTFQLEPGFGIEIFAKSWRDC